MSITTTFTCSFHPAPRASSQLTTAFEVRPALWPRSPPGPDRSTKLVSKALQPGPAAVLVPAPAGAATAGLVDPEHLRSSRLDQQPLSMGDERRMHDRPAHRQLTGHRGHRPTRADRNCGGPPAPAGDPRIRRPLADRLGERLPPTLRLPTPELRLVPPHHKRRHPVRKVPRPGGATLPDRTREHPRTSGTPPRPRPRSSGAPFGHPQRPSRYDRPLLRAARTKSSYRSPRSRLLSPAALDTASVEDREPSAHNTKIVSRSPLNFEESRTRPRTPFRRLRRSQGTFTPTCAHDL